MRSIVIGTLALAGVTLAAPAHSQSIWVGGPGFSFGFGAGPTYAYGEPYHRGYWGGPAYWDDYAYTPVRYRTYRSYGYEPAHSYAPGYTFAHQPGFTYGYAPRHRLGHHVYASSPRYYRDRRHHVRVGTRTRVTATFRQPAPSAGFHAYASAAVPPGPGYAYVRQANAMGQCWVSTDNTRGFGYWGSCASRTVDRDAATLGQARRNVSRVR